MTPEERTEMAGILRGYARQLTEKARPIFEKQIERLHRQADALEVGNGRDRSVLGNGRDRSVPDGDRSLHQTEETA